MLDAFSEPLQDAEVIARAAPSQDIAGASQCTSVIEPEVVVKDDREIVTTTGVNYSFEPHSRFAWHSWATINPNLNVGIRDVGSTSGACDDCHPVHRTNIVSQRKGGRVLAAILGDDDDVEQLVWIHSEIDWTYEEEVNRPLVMLVGINIVACLYDERPSQVSRLNHGVDAAD